MIGKIEQSVVVPGSYKEIPKHYSAKGLLISEKVAGSAYPISLLDLLTAIPKGMQQSAVLIFFIFIIGAVFNIIHYTGAINAVLFYLIEKFRNNPTLLFFLIYMLIFSGSSFMGIHIETIPLIPIFLLLAKQTGYDRLFGISLILFPVFIGWTTAVTNPYTVQIAQKIAELPMGSGIGLRIGLYFVCAIVGFAYLMRYGNRVKNNKTASIMKDDPFEIKDVQNLKKEVLTSKHILILTVMVISYAFIMIAVQTMDWGLIEMSGGFIGIGIMTILISRMSGDESMNAFVKGLETMIVPALVVGVARGISVVMQEGQIIDTILFYASNGLSTMPKILAGEGMLFFQTLLNFFIPSASGQALVSMPLMTPLADLLDISRQTAVLAFILGDGFSNIIIPTNGVLMAMLGIAAVPFEKWFRMVIPLFLILMLIAMATMMVAILIGY